jgi:hypothetical protein
MDVPWIGMVELPMILESDRDDPDCASVFVDGWSEGRRRRFLLDTGAAMSQVPRDWLAHESPGQGERTGVAALGSTHQRLGQVDSLRVGSLEVRKVTVGVLAEEHPHFWGLLGMDVLGQEAWEFDFAGRRVGVGSVESDADRRWSRLDRCPSGQPLVEMNVGPVPATAVWDSGAGITLVDASFHHRHADLFVPAGSATGTDSGGNQAETPLAVMAASRIADVDFPSCKVAIVDLVHATAALDRPMHLILGYTLIQSAAWIFDFPRQRWVVTPAGLDSSAPGVVKRRV